MPAVLLVTVLLLTGCGDSQRDKRDLQDGDISVDMVLDTEPDDGDVDIVDGSGDVSPDQPDVSDGDTSPTDVSDASDVNDVADTPADMDMMDDMESPWGTCMAGDQPGICLDVSECDGGRVTTPNLCPGPANIRCCHEPTSTSTCDPQAMVVPSATFVEAPGSPGCPDGMQRIDDYCIDRYEAVLVEVLSNGSTVPWSPFFNPSQTRVKALSVANAVPQGYISGDQAAAACAEAGKRLCTDTEWLRACQGASGLTYPYGNTRQPGVCNDARSPHPVVDYFGTSESWIWSELDHPCISQQDNTLDRTGENSGCVSSDGVYDMMGNLHEWTATSSGHFRGGFYADTAINGNGCLYLTTAHSTLHWDYSTGFRCCADAL